MDLEFPRMAYKVGGPWALDAGKFSVREVTAEEYEALQAEGWRLDQYAALEAPQSASATQGDGNGQGQEGQDGQGRQERLLSTSGGAVVPPTREQMEADATRLGVKFDGRTSDRKLAALILSAAEAAQG